MDLIPIATAEELRAATQHFLGRPKKSDAERCADWIDWLRRRAGKLFKDAAAAGRWAVELEPPFQPSGAEELVALRGFARSLKPLFPGCRIAVCEEECEIERALSQETIRTKEIEHYSIEISWVAPQKPGGQD